MPVAIVEEGAAKAEVQLAADETIWLDVSLAAGSGNHFGPGCPTLQIDQRLPLLQPPVGSDCKVTATQVSLLLGRRDPGRVRSRLIHGLVNGTQLALRYQTQERRYVELIFPLARSKQAVKAALADTLIRPD
jgi:hypothetical protein